MKAIIIDPVPYQRRILAQLLRARGHETIEECERIEAGPSTIGPDDILFIEAAIHQDAPPNLVAAGALVIVTGAERAEALIARQFDRGAHAFLTKPYTNEGLETALTDGQLMKECSTA